MSQAGATQCGQQRPPRSKNALVPEMHGSVHASQASRGDTQHRCRTVRWPAARCVSSTRRLEYLLRCWHIGHPVMSQIAQMHTKRSDTFLPSADIRAAGCKDAPVRTEQTRPVQPEVWPATRVQGSAAASNAPMFLTTCERLDSADSSLSRQLIQARAIRRCVDPCQCMETIRLQRFFLD